MLDPKTTDYCVKCGHSPDSMIHFMGIEYHEYEYPNPAATPQPPPQTSTHPPILDLVELDLKARAEFGHRKYGTYLRGHDGRDSLTDAYQESLDQTMYLRKALYERNGK